MVTDFKTCAVCGDESPNDGTGIWAAIDASGGREVWVHRGPCFLEYGLLQNASSLTMKKAIVKMGNLHRLRAEAWKTAATGSAAEVARLRPLLERCLEGLEWNLPKAKERELLADLRRELGLPDHQ